MRFKKGITTLVVLIVGTLAILSAAIALPLASPPLVGESGDYAITDTNVIDIHTGDVRSGLTVIIESGEITGLQNGGQLPTGIKMIQGTGKYVIPALWDMHTHGLKVSPQIHHALFISNGVTGARDMSGCMDRDDNYWACPADRRRWTEQAKKGERISPIYVLQSSYQLNGGQEVPQGFPEFFRIADLAAAKKLVDFYRDQQVDFIKPYTELSREQYDNLVRQAKDGGLDLAGHKPIAVSLERALDAGQKSIEHGRLFLFECYDGIEKFRQLADPITHYDATLMRTMLRRQNEEKCSQLMGRMAASETWWTPTLTTLQMGAYSNDAAFRQDARQELIPYVVNELIWQPDIDRAARNGLDEEGVFVRTDFFEHAKAQVDRAQQMGVKLLAGTDNIDTYVFTGSSLHDELSMMVDAGLSPLQALRTATINPAIYAGMDQSYGSVEPGKRADLLLLNANPLADIDNTRDIHGLMYNGAYYDRDALNTLEAFARNMAASIRLNLKYLWSLFASPLMRVQLAD